MQEGQPSRTAITAALWRAAHLLLDDEPKVFRDDFAMRFAGFASTAALRAALTERETLAARRMGANLATFMFSGLRAITAARSRYAEDELANAVQRGVAQYVLLGAGLDSFAYRRPDLERVLRIFEVDHPGSQQWKRARLQELAIPVPGNLVFVPLDFENQTLRAALRAAGFREGEPAFFSWLGVTHYLTEEATLQTLQEIAALAPGTEIVFQYFVPEEQLEGRDRQYLALLKGGTARVGEPCRGFFEPLRLAALLKDLGFREITDSGAEEINARYLANRRDGLRFPGASRLMKATVGAGPGG
jgi:methyltransferase (TIGR00027 family)